MVIYCDAAYRFSQIGLVGDEDDIYIFQCLLQEAIYIKLCEAVKVKSTPTYRFWGKLKEYYNENP